MTVQRSPLCVCEHFSKHLILWSTVRKASYKIVDVYALRAVDGTTGAGQVVFVKVLGMDLPACDTKA